MQKLLVVTLLSYLALGCKKSPPLPRVNNACRFVHMVDDKAVCESLYTGSLLPDTAYVRNQGGVFWCEASLTAKPKCEMLVPQPKAEAEAPPPTPGLAP